MGKKKRTAVLDREAHYDVTPHGTATYLLLSHGARLLVVRNEQRSLSDLYVVDETGIWIRGDEVLLQWMFERGDTLRREGMGEGMDEKAVSGLLRSIRPLFDPRQLKHVRAAAAASLAKLHDSYRRINAAAEWDFGVTTCLETKLDAKMRYLGTANGVVDLHAGELLTPEEGRKHLVTHRTPVPFEPDAHHPDVDRLLAHLPPDERDWWWSVLGYALRGSPSARIYEVVGPPNGGKSGLLAALAATLGPYAGVPSAGLLEYRRGAVEGETGLSPTVVAMVPPRRFALFDEVKPARLNHKLMKDWSGDGAGVTWQPKYQDPRTNPVSATMFLSCNTGQEARLGMQDAGMRRRLRTLRYPAIPPEDVIENFNTVRIHDPAFQTVLLARLVKAASEGTTGAPPEAPQSVMESTAERIVEDVGEITRFARRLVRGGEVLTVTAVWHAWCEHNEEDPGTAITPDGIPRQRLSRVLCDHVVGLPKPKQIRVDGKNVRGWRDWRLLTAEEVENESVAQQVVADLLAAVKNWDKDQIESVISLLHRHAEGYRMEFEGRTYLYAPAYSYMDSEEKSSAAFERAYKRLSPMRADRRSIYFETEIAIILAEDYLVQAAYKLPDATLGALASEATRLMTADMSTASEEFTPAAKLLTSELEKIIRKVCEEK